MARFGNVIMVYFIIGAVMWGGGAIVWTETGLNTLIIQDPQSGQVNENTSSQLEDAGGPIREAAQSFGGPVLAIWNIVVQFVGYLFWPVATLQSVGAPPRLTVLLGGPPSVAFLGGVIRLIRESA
jgi:hypothetical protein